MRIERLQIELRPRPHAQALDLGLALLRAHAGDVYRVWLALWLTAMGVALALCWLLPALAAVWLLLPWWLRPALERGPLYVLSRAVFGERTTWRAALRAWPSQLGGGMWHMLTWWRPFMAGRGLYHAVWQLEGARGKQAATRRAVLGRGGAGSAAWLFGSACGFFESVLCIGTVALVSLFMPSNTELQPTAALELLTDGTSVAAVLLPAAVLAVAGALIGPVYTACCFTLYLNRRATLEAWDIELVLRRLHAPVTRSRGVATVLAAPLLALACVAALVPPPADAAPTACRADWRDPLAPRGQQRSAEQARLRAEVDRLYDEPDLRGYRCEEAWQLKEQEADKPKVTPNASLPPWLGSLAYVLKLLLIGAAVLGAAWLLYRYRDRLPSFARSRAPARATEIGGLDIRPDSLPDDVTGTVRALWREGRQRAALALLYRATLSRLVSDHGLHLYPGATEGDCLRIARQAHAAGTLDDMRVQATADVTEIWLHGAYGGRWPDDERVLRACAAWERCFAQAAESTA